jgi:hypothetical protein
MDILAYDYLLENLKHFNTKIKENYGNKIYSETPMANKNKTILFPFTVFEEINNTGNKIYNGCRDKLSNLSFSLTIYAKTKGNVSKKTIARHLAKELNEYLSEYVGLHRIGFIQDGFVEDGAIQRIIITYSGTLHENRRKFI